MYTISKQIGLESPGCSGFVANLKGFKICLEVVYVRTRRASSFADLNHTALSSHSSSSSPLLLLLPHLFPLTSPSSSSSPSGLMDSLETTKKANAATNEAFKDDIVAQARRERERRGCNEKGRICRNYSENVSKIDFFLVG